MIDAQAMTGALMNAAPLTDVAHFIRVRDDLVIEKGWTDEAARAVMQERSAEYRAVTRAQHDALSLGDPAP